MVDDQKLYVMQRRRASNKCESCLPCYNDDGEMHNQLNAQGAEVPVIHATESNELRQCRVQ